MLRRQYVVTNLVDRFDESMVEALTLPTAASPSRTSLTLLLGFGAEGVAESVIGEVADGDGFARRLRPTL